MVSQQLVEQWRVRLAAWRQRLDEGRPRPWLARAYVRVLSFLLAQYGSGRETSVGTPMSETIADASAPRDRSAMRFEAVSPELSGKPPRSREDIRSVLEAVRAKVPHVEQGPLSDGLHPDDPIVVAAFYHPGFAVGLREELEAKGIESSSKRFRRQTQVIVRAADLERAKPIIASHAAFARDSSAHRWQHAKAWSRRGAGIGTLVGVLITVTATSALLLQYAITSDDAPWVAFAIFYVSAVICVDIGALIGLILGQMADS